MPPGSTPARFIATSDEAPQSISTASAPSVSSRQVWKRPPLPNASPEPRKRSESAMAGPQGVGVGRSAGPYTSDAVASAGTGGIVAAQAS